MPVYLSHGVYEAGCIIICRESIEFPGPTDRHVCSPADDALGAALSDIVVVVVTCVWSGW